MDNEGKVCIECGERKACDQFYPRSGRLGYLSRCKPCHNARTLADYHARQETSPRPTKGIWHRDQTAVEKTCTTCGKTLPIDQFFLKRPKTGNRRAVCTPCHNAANLEHKRANAEQLREQRLAYYAANRNRLLEKQKRYREENPVADQITHAKWKSSNKDKVNAATHRRRNQIVTNGGHWTAEEWQALVAEFDHRCLFCWRQEPEITLHVDHIVPVALGGSNDITNLQPLCKPCNSRKHTQTLDLRPAARERLAQERHAM